MGLVLVGMSAVAGPQLTPHTAEYKIEISIVNGKLTTQFEKTDTGYFADSVIEATGLSRILTRGSIREKSWFSERDGSILPTQYRSADTISSDKDVIDLNFDWNLREVTGLINGVDFRAPLEGDVHDRVSLQYGLMYDLLNGGAREQYFLQDAEELKPLTISNIGTKAVKVPFGRFNAVGIQHQREGSSRVTTMWCVAELGYLPVVIEQHRKGKLRLRAELAKYQPLTTGS
jgi:hypothetical protein